jgi:methyl-accepting chemotaxis protein
MVTSMRQLTVGKKLTLGVAALVLSVLGLGGTSLIAISTLGNSLDTAVNKTARKLDLAGATAAAFQNLKQTSVREQLAHLIAETERRGSNLTVDGMACSACHAPSSVTDSIAALEQSGAQTRGKLAELAALVDDAASRKALATISGGADSWVDLNRQYLTIAGAGKFEEAHRILSDKMFPLLEPVEKAATTLSEREHTLLAADDLEAHRSISRNRWTAFALIGLNLLVAAGVLWLIAQITRALRHAVTDISEATARVNVEAGNVTVTTKSVADGSCAQAASVEETSASSEEISSMAAGNCERLRKAAELVVSSQNRMGTVELSLADMVRAMEEINEQSVRITKIIKVIDDIAFQTNVLALNAAVEAARAGEAGMGFAVVADEVRNLAQRCANAARETGELIAGSTAKATEGKASVDHVAVAIRAVAGEAGQVRILVEEVHKGSQEQSAGMTQIAKAMTQIDHVTQATAASAETSRSSCEVLSAQARTLNLVGQRLHGLVSGSNARQASQHEQLQLALAAHGAWKQRLRHAIDSGFCETPVRVAERDDQCAFGKWLFGNSISRDMAQSNGFRRVVDLHRRFHRTAAGVLALALEGRKADAACAMAPGSDFAELSARLAAALTDLLR